LLFPESIEQLEIRISGRPRLVLVADALAEEVERCRGATRIQLTDRCQCLVGRLPRHEAHRQVLGEPVVSDE
jgi:hypothetical protein